LQNNQPLSNLNNNPLINMTFDTNAVNILTVALTNLNTTLVARREEKKAVNYLFFNRREDKDINDFITELEKAFAINRVVNRRKYLIAISCLKGTATNFYDKLVGITN